MELDQPPGTPGSLPSRGAPPRAPAVLFPADLLPPFAMVNPTPRFFVWFDYLTQACHITSSVNVFNHYPPFVMIFGPRLP